MRALWLVLFLAVSAAALWPILAADDDRPVATSTLLDAEAVLRSDGTEFAFTVRKPSRLRVFIHLPMDLSGTIRMGPAAPASRRDIAYVPRRDDDVVFEAAGMMATPIEWTVMAVGPYFVRVEPIPTAMGEMDPKIHAVVYADPIE